MPAGPVCEQGEQRVAAGGDAGAGLESLEVGGEGAGVWVAASGVGIEGFEDDGGEVGVDAGAAEQAMALAGVVGGQLVERA